MRPLAEVARDPDADSAADQLVSLTRRQEQVLDLLSRGCSHEEVARSLGISRWTVKHHRDAAVRALRAANVAEAVAIYVRSVA